MIFCLKQFLLSFYKQLQHLSALKDSYDELKCHHEREMKSLNKEVKELRQEKERNASQCRDAQAVS